MRRGEPGWTKQPPRTPRCEEERGNGKWQSGNTDVEPTVIPSEFDESRNLSGPPQIAQSSICNSLGCPLPPDGGSGSESDSKTNSNRYSARYSERNSLRDSEKDSDRESDRDSDRSSERNSKKDSARNSKRYSDRDSYRDSDRESDRNSKRNSDRNSARNSNKDSFRYSIIESIRYSVIESVIACFKPASRPPKPETGEAAFLRPWGLVSGAGDFWRAAHTRAGLTSDPLNL